MSCVPLDTRAPGTRTGAWDEGLQAGAAGEQAGRAQAAQCTWTSGGKTQGGKAPRNG